ncbi:MAG: glutaredoxin family protein [Promethearchaeota archaeon]|nr:MAG: glutaredoxin family protein [Candidatus Lokiarchaeota archaeon]
MNEFPEFIKELFEEVDGKNDKQDVSIFTISTCQWCKRCKAYLKDRDIKYKYIDVDNISFEEKSKILQFLRENYKPDRIAYPFLVCDDKFVVGYDPNQYEELMKSEEK